MEEDVDIQYIFRWNCTESNVGLTPTHHQKIVKWWLTKLVNVPFSIKDREVVNCAAENMASGTAWHMGVVILDDICENMRFSDIFNAIS